MDRIDPHSSTPPYQQIAAELVRRIRSGEWKPGHQLPTTYDAAEQWGVSLSTVQRAYNLLRDRGLTETRRTYGTYVRDTGGGR